MKSLFAVLFFVACLTSCTSVTYERQENTVQSELRLLEGNWRIDSETIDGQKEPDEVRKITMTYMGHHWIQRKDDVILNEGNSEFRPSMTPKQIDISPLGGPAAGKVLPGIYRLNQDTYESCFALPGKDRPTKFSSTPGSGQVHVIFKRAYK